MYILWTHIIRIFSIFSSHDQKDLVPEDDQPTSLAVEDSLQEEKEEGEEDQDIVEPALEAAVEEGVEAILEVKPEDKAEPRLLGSALLIEEEEEREEAIETIQVRGELKIF